MTERPASSWEGAGAAELALRWDADVRLYETLGSTNDVARRLAGAGERLPLVVLSEEQRAGRGRAGRGWASPAGLGLWVSVAVPPPGAGDFERLSVRVGLAVAEALDEFVAPEARVGLKWPNDLWIGGAKVGGILCEAVWEGARPGPVVIGVGLNLRHSAADLPAGSGYPATSVALAAGRPPAPLDVADRVVPAILGAAAAHGRLPVERLRARDVLFERPLEIADPMTGVRVAEGSGAGIDEGGALLLRTAQGLRPIHSGSVRLLG